MSFFRFAAVAVSLVTLSSSAFAQAASAPLTKADVAAIVKETIMNDPEMIMQALEKLRVEKAEKSKKEAAASLNQIRGDLFNNPNTPAAGAAAADADVVMAEFFDYHCGYCKHFLPELSKVLAEDKKVRVVFIDFPILSEDSVTAARAAIAVSRIKKDKYFEFHAALMQSSGRFDEKAVIALAQKFGIKAAALKEEMGKPEVTAALDKNREMAQKLGITGTPGIVIGNDIFPGAVSADELKGMIANVRKGKEAAANPAAPVAK